MNVAFIPVRGESKTIPLKNIRPICGEPLVYWAVKAACECRYIDIVFVASDNNQIKCTVEQFKSENALFDKVQVISRSPESASDTASTEYAMMEFAADYVFDNIALIQATSPMLTGKDLDGGFELFSTEGTDSVLSVVRQYRFIWEQNKGGIVKPSNYDVFNRPRRQDFDGYLVENGAFYITSKVNLLRSQNRVSGNIKAYEMCEDSAYEIDSPSDWIILEALMKKNGMAPKKGSASNIKMLLTDCDGCLTDAGMYYSEFGDELKKFNTRDGMGFALLQQKGILTGIVTSESVKLNERRAKKLNLDIFVEGCKDKCSAIQKLCDEHQIPLKNVAYIGDDINDKEIIQMVGFGCCPADATSVVKDVATYCAHAKGGEGVIREVADLILENMK